MVEVKYVGSKPFAIDNVARSGKTWQGNGDVQTVTDPQAKRLTGYPDQWVLADPKDAGKLAVKGQVETVGADGKPELVDEIALKSPLEKMDAGELIAYAKQHYGKTFKHQMGRKRLLDEVEALVRSQDAIDPGA